MPFRIYVIAFLSDDCQIYEVFKRKKNAKNKIILELFLILLFGLFLNLAFSHFDLMDLLSDLFEMYI